MEIESALSRLREATAEINKATDDAEVKNTLEKTWLLQDRLVFPHRVRFHLRPIRFLHNTNNLSRTWMPQPETKYVHLGVSSCVVSCMCAGKRQSGLMEST